jgi:hypothetical protein
MYSSENVQPTYRQVIRTTEKLVFLLAFPHLIILVCLSIAHPPIIIVSYLLGSSSISSSIPE